MNKPMDSRQIVSAFWENKNEQGWVRLSAKQVQWLVGQLRREQLVPEGPLKEISIQGKLGEYFKLIIRIDGTGELSPNHNDPAIFRRKI